MAKPIAIIALVLSIGAALLGGIAFALQLSGDGSAAAGATSTVDLNVQSDPCHHDQFIFASPTGGTLSHNMSVKITISPASGQVNITGPQPWVKVTGTYDSGTGQITNGQGSGTVAGIQSVSVGFEGTFSGGQIGGKYAFGTHGELPSGNCPGGTPQPAVYTVKPKPTPTTTPTGTPQITPTGTPQKLYSIIVLKLNDDTNQPLPGWRMNLFRGSGCSGNSITSLTTDTHGLADFMGLVPGTYSVQEKMQTGWNPDGPVCQDATVGGTAGPATGAPPPCPVQPDQPFPQPGCDSFFSAARVVVELNGTTTSYTVNLSGPTQIERLNKPRPKASGLDTVDTDLVFMKLTGTSPFGPVTVRQSPSRLSLGRIQEQNNITTGTMDFPANSFFDVFFEVDVPGAGTLHNEQAFHMQCKIDAIPPYLCFYLPPISTPIPLLNADGVKIAKLIHAMHIPLPPNEKLIIFSNRPKLTPTITPTPPAETPSPTNPPPNGTCNKVAQGVQFQNGTWDQWKCLPPVPPPPNPRFNRIDIFVGSATQQPVLSAAHFVCQSTNEKVQGVFKAHKMDVNPGTNLPNSDVWSGTFHEKCTGGVTVYVQPVSAAVHPIIVQVAFTDTQPVTVTPTPTFTVTPTATQEQLQRHVRLRCNNDFSGIKFTGTATITEKKAGRPDTVRWSGSCSTNGPRTLSADYKVSRGAIKNYVLTITTAGGPVTTCPQKPRVAATQNVRITCQLSPDGIDLVDSESGATTFIGDVNCDDNADPIDSALILQLVAGLLNSLSCQQNADVNGDGSTNAIDSSLILQFSAALIHSLPPAVP